MPTAAQARALGIAAIVDVCAELPAPATVPTRSVPMLDLIPPQTDALRAAADAIEAQLDATQADGGTVLVCCALGYSRSAAAVAAWMLRYGHASDADAAIAQLRAARPQLVLYDEHRLALAALMVTS
jgi:protein-tyrosine phosphatase